jgi:beta-N-acetylhexosaminidase
MKKTISTLILLVLLNCQLIWANKNDVKSNKKAEKWIEKTLKNLSLREKIGQMIMVRMLGDFTNLDSEQFVQIRKNVTDDKLGGFIIARGDANSVAVMTNELQKISAIPLLFAADYERGLRMQMRTGTPFTWNMGVAATGDPQAAYRQGKIIATEMRAIGVNWLFAPVADINNNPDNPVINVRSYGRKSAESFRICHGFWQRSA